MLNYQVAKTCALHATDRLELIRGVGASATLEFLCYIIMSHSNSSNSYATSSIYILHWRSTSSRVLVMQAATFLYTTATLKCTRVGLVLVSIDESRARAV